jgi:hypothetical protein
MSFSTKWFGQLKLSGFTSTGRLLTVGFHEVCPSLPLLDASRKLWLTAADEPCYYWCPHMRHHTFHRTRSYVKFGTLETLSIDKPPPAYESSGRGRRDWHVRWHSVDNASCRLPWLFLHWRMPYRVRLRYKRKQSCYSGACGFLSSYSFLGT